MSALGDHTKRITLELRVNAERNTMQLVETIAQALGVEAGEYAKLEWVRLAHLKNVTEKKEAPRAKANL